MKFKFLLTYIFVPASVKILVKKLVNLNLNEHFD